MDNNNKRIRLLFIISTLIAIAFGIFGLRLSGLAITDAAFYTLTMFVLNYADPAPNLFVEIARWLAAISTAAFVASFLELFLKRIRSLRLRFSDDSIVVYYDTSEYDEASLPTPIPGRTLYCSDPNRLYTSKRYLLLMSDEENLAFADRYAGKLQGRKVYLECTSLRPAYVKKDGITLFCKEELGARLFWKQAGVYELYTKKGCDLKFAIIGSGTLCEQLMLFGLQHNIYSPGQHFEYHIFGGDDNLRYKYRSLDALEDSVIFHDEPWYKSTVVMDSMDMIIVCEQNMQLKLMQELIFALPGKLFHVLTRSAADFGIFEQNDRFIFFDYEAAAFSRDNLFDEKHLELAKRMNLQYWVNNEGMENTVENMKRLWNEDSSFNHYSNIASADYHETLMDMLNAKGIKPGDVLDAGNTELFAELEHIRWCRFHYLNNWRFGSTENNKKDKLNRIHPLLIPYSSLSEEDKQKDRDMVLMSMNMK